MLILGGTWCEAHPVSYKGATQLWGNYNDSIQMSSLFHSFESDWALGVHHMRLDGNGVDRTIAGFRYHRLLKRWNLEDAQANLYAGIGGGLGYDDPTEDWRPAGLGLFRADWETRRLLAIYQMGLSVTDDYTHVFNSANFGIAPYIAGYEDLNTWLVVELRYLSEFHEKLQVIPKVRFFKDNVFFEAGASTDGQLQLNFMVHF